MLDDGEVLELVWKNGQVVIQSKNKKSTAESSIMNGDNRALNGDEDPLVFMQENEMIAESSITNRDNRALNGDEDPQAFMQENETISLLDYSLVVDPALENIFREEILYPTLLRSTEQNARDSLLGRTRHGMEFRQPIPMMRRTEPLTAANGFGVFPKHTGRVEPGPSNSKSVIRECPVVGPGGTSWLAVADASSGDLGCRITSGGDNVGRLINVTGGEMEAAFQRMMSLEDWKRKGKEKVVSDYHHRSTGFEYQPTDAKKQGLGLTSMKRSRAADVHNLSERKRRDRINERMKDLQELIPDCTKTDKASMLSEAIEYVKSLQLLLQIMSPGGGTGSTVVPGVQQVTPPMGMGFGTGTGVQQVTPPMGMGFGTGTGVQQVTPPMGMEFGTGTGMNMGMETSVNRPMIPYPNTLAGSAFPRPAGAAQLGQPFIYPAVHMVPMAPVPITDPSRFQGTNQLDHMHYYSSGMQNIYQPRVSSSLDTYQQFLASQQMYVPEAVPHLFAQNLPAALLRSHNQHTSWGHESIGNHEPGSPTMDPY